ncbi:MAG: sulfotransferase [Mastigocoleus sp. MO_167.B18]|uniref:sulfotransferase n=1 Tax=Mastigocoleus sp. MO_188.B34 TaxID=3036635 RepID=UPI00260D8A01|nr:sulfotransferase [Mastigocoleus sp. MO_188.B34]MDJ0693235.1 sulfotransferase [Mastigocoleus sp. MO_188.B34]MDJ0773595.1 sulfotransferase [Mastigocoleus sp. MO_167.B18]
MKNPIKILYILSSGHSGSTLTDLILGSHSEIESGGEIDRLHDYISERPPGRGEIERVCTCKKNIKDCAYWEAVLSKIDSDKYNIGANIESEEIEVFEESNFKLIEAILEVSEKTIFCDSSKSYPRLVKFLKSNKFAVEIIHLVRDPRAVAYSVRRKGLKLNDESYNFFNALKNYKKVNSKWFSEFSGLDNYHLLKYENIVQDTEKEVKRLMQELGLNFEKDQFEFWKNEHHNIGGNRMRLQNHKSIRKDDEYLSNISFKDWYLASIKTFPQLKTFGYPILKNMA